MKTKIYSFLLFCAVFMIAQNTNAQCGTRYHDLIFSAVTKTTVVYSTSNSTSLSMDIYQPTGDVETSRPVIIMAHGGSFISGNRSNDNVCTQICNNYAKRGYVCASIDYRLDPAFGLGMLDSVNAITIVMKAISDGKSAVRFFRKDAATTNTYKIDPTKIFCGGNSAGAVLYAHCAFIDSLNEAPAHLRSIITANGGIEGNSGNDGYSSQMTALINLAGGLNVPEFVGPGNTPSFNAQGDADLTVPYMCGKAQNGQTPVRLCGLGAMKPLYDQYALNYYSIIYPGEGHVPWQSNSAEMTQIDTTCANFLLQFVCADTAVTTSVSEITSDNLVQIYPNPAKDMLYISLKDVNTYSNIQIMDATGRVVVENKVTDMMMTIDIHGLSGGIYMVKVTKANGVLLVKKLMVD